MSYPQSLKHAEWDVFGQAGEAGGTSGVNARLYVDQKPCHWCQRNFGTWSRYLGLNDLTVKARGGYLGRWFEPIDRYMTLVKGVE
jgi:hypothetical protein